MKKWILTETPTVFEESLPDIPAGKAIPAPPAGTCALAPPSRLDIALTPALELILVGGSPGTLLRAIPTASFNATASESFTAARA